MGDAYDKTLTFVGAGIDKTFWQVGNEKNAGDDSFQHTAAITFRDITFKTINAYHDGFNHAGNTVTDHCKIIGRTHCRGAPAVSFYYTTFEGSSSPLLVYTASTYNIDNCVFNVPNNAVSIDVGNPASDVINFSNNTVKGDTAVNDAAIVIHDGIDGKTR